MKTLNKSIALTILGLSSFIAMSQAQAAEPTIQPQKQVAGYYQHQLGNVQITALLDGTNYLSPALFKDIPATEVTQILKKYHADQAKKHFKTFKLGDKVKGFEVISTAGHTPGHFSFAFKSGNEEIVFVGDIVHSHSIQFDHPETAIDFDVDPKKAVQTRLAQFSRLAKNGQTVAAPHLPFPGIGHIYSKDGKSYQWIPVHFKD